MIKLRDIVLPCSGAPLDPDGKVFAPPIHRASPDTYIRFYFKWLNNFEEKMHFFLKSIWTMPILCMEELKCIFMAIKYIMS